MPQQTRVRRGKSGSNGRTQANRSAGTARGATSTVARANGRIRESDLTHLRVDQLRAQLRSRGVTGTSNLRKPELIKSLAQAMRRGTPARAQQASRPRNGAPAARRNGSNARKSTAGTAGKSTAGGARKSAAGRARKSAAGTAGKSTASARKSTSAARKSSTPARKSTTAAGRGGGTATRKNGSGARKSATTGAGKIRTGGSSSRSLRYAQRIDDPRQHAERAGRSLVTTDHEVIRQWAEARGGRPATVGAPRDGRASVLRFDFPGYGGANLRPISWNEWFETFDLRRLNFIYQEQRTDGTQSNFFRLESPDREDA
ncbi:hypothetical protein ACN27F_14250 [Solwaraspora sp. WMMB335]|uniref:hypothetical protein n=1 Tax=Solwaraspora sp. WMMB335 TaxID=3404118 RepID=UPI003B95AC18